MSEMRLSYSQLSSWAQCGERHRLERVVRVPSVPSWALIGGSSVHEVTENYDMNRLGVPTPEPDFREVFERRIAEAEDESGVSRDRFQAAGRVSRDWPAKENMDWWLANGPAMFRRWVTFTQATPWDIWIMPNGRPAVEVGFDLRLNSGVIVRGYVDRVFEDDHGLIVGDIKSGASKQPTPRQLGTYKVGLEDMFPGFAFDRGTFWDARSGVSTALTSLHGFTRARIEWQYGAVHQAKDLGIYLPNPSMMCGSCGVRESCYEYTQDADAAVKPPWVSDEEWGEAA